MAELLDRLKTALADRYRIEREIGAGAMATVYLAGDVKHHRSVAVKVLRPELSTAIARERFLREIEIAAQLSHPHILPVHDSGEADGFLFYSMPYVDGESLRTRMLREGPLRIEEALHIAGQIASALGYAHSLGLVHRDIKPENILLHHGEAMIVDFGIAKAISDTSVQRLTVTGLAIGTPAYMSPEQVAGDRHLDARSDVYALACVVYEMLAGDPPFVASNPQALMAKHVTDPAPSITTMRPGVPPPAAAALARGLEKVAADRYQSAGEFALGLTAEASATDEGTTSIVVLPFANMSPDPDNEYFSDGLTEELINALGQLEGLHVASRTSAFQFKGQHVDIRRIGRELGVDAVLEGSVRRSGQRLRITAQLVDVANGYHLWSERYDRALEDVFAIQEEIAQTIVEKLKVKLIAEHPARIVEPPTKNLEAYSLYLKGRFFWNKRNDENFIKATESFEHAVEHDAEYALAYSGLADAYALLGIAEYALRRPHDALPKAREAARKALALNENLAESWTTLAHIAAFYDWDWDEAERLFRRAIELNPQYAMAHHWCAAYHAAMARHDEALRAEKRARELEPLSLIINKNVGAVLYYSRRHEDAIEVLLKTLHLEPTFVRTRFYLGLAYQEVGMVDEAIMELRECVRLSEGNSVCQALLGHALARGGQVTEARQVLQQLQAVAQSRYIPPLNHAFVHLGLGEVDEAFAFLEQAYDERSSWLVSLNVEPLFDPIREDPRFTGLVARVGLAD